jgi:hypothetical protein
LQPGPGAGALMGIVIVDEKDFLPAVNLAVLKNLGLSLLDHFTAKSFSVPAIKRIYHLKEY